MRTIGFVLVLLGIVTIYLAVKEKIGAAFTAIVTGQVPSGTNSIEQTALNAAGNLSNTATQQNTQNIIKNNKNLTDQQKKTYSDALNPFSPSHGGALGG